MIDLENTTILASSDPDSQNTLTKLLEIKTMLTVIIFGNDTLSSTTVEKADVRATAIIAGIQRRVIWIQDSTMLPFLSSLISNGQFQVQDIDLSKHIGIGLSLNLELKDLIPRNPAPNYTRLETAFL